MALRKDQVIVWFSQTEKGNQKQLFLLACPYSRLKDVDNRLQAAVTKKVKGSRLEHLDPGLLEEASIPFVQDYLDTIFRIADLCGFGITYPAKAAQLEQKALNLASSFLKEQYPGCEFLIRYDERKIRASLISGWMRKTQLPAQVDPTDLSTSVGLQSARLLGALSKGSSDALISDLYEKVRMQSLMARKWKLVLAKDLYLDLVEGKAKDSVQTLFERIPELVEEGQFEKWLKKKVTPDFLAKTADLAADPDLKELILTSAPNRLEAQYETLKANQKQAELPFPQEDFDAFANVYADHFVSLLDPARCGVDKEDWKSKSKQLLMGWIEQPEQTGRQKDTIYMMCKDKTLCILQTSLSECLAADLEAGKEIPSGTWQYTEIPVHQLDDFLERISQTHPIPKLYLKGWLNNRIRKWSIENNRFLPLYELERSHEQMLDRFTTPARTFVYPPAVKKEGTRWFSPEVEDALDVEDYEFLINHPLNAQETRLLASSLAAGLSRNKAAQYLVRNKAPFYGLVRTYLFSSKVQRFLDRRKFVAEQTMLLKPNLSLAAMKRIHGMVMNGIPVDWLNTNLAGGMSLSAMDRMELQYPYGVLPYTWQVFSRMPESLEQWLLAKAKLANPRHNEAALQVQLDRLNENFAVLLMQNDKRK